jgi:hypothetical protein
MSKFWFLDHELKSYIKLSRLAKRAPLGQLNSSAFSAAMTRFQIAMNGPLSDDGPLPPDFMIPQLAMPETGFAPDYLDSGGARFCSRRFRDAMAQPENVVQYLPVELITGGAEVRAQDYRLMRVMAIQSAMDLDRSDCRIREWTHRITGEIIRSPDNLRRVVLIEDLQPRTEIFRVAESPVDVLVVDALADRVLRAGCTGIAFAHIDNLRIGNRKERYRTVDGLREQIV